MKRKDIDIEVNNWKTLCTNADIAIEKLMCDFLVGGITPIEVFSRVREMEVDFYPDIDVSKETINSIVDFMVATGVEEENAKNAYYNSQTEDMFQKLIRRNSQAKVKFYVVEHDAQGDKSWDYQDSEEMARKQFNGYINYFGRKANNLTLYKALIEDSDTRKIEVIFEERIDLYLNSEINNGEK